MRRVLVAAGYMMAGAAIALILTFGAFAIAGQDVSEPATPTQISIGPTPPTASPTPGHGGDEGKPNDDASHETDGSPSPGVTVDDHGGSSSGTSNSGGSGDSGSDSDGSEHDGSDSHDD